MISGKAVSRTLRGHFILDSSLHSLLAAQALDISPPFLSEHSDDVANVDANVAVETTDLLAVLAHQKLRDLTFLMKKLLSGDVNIENVEICAAVSDVREKVSKIENDVSKSRTAALWMQYMDMVELL